MGVFVYCLLLPLVTGKDWCLPIHVAMVTAVLDSNILSFAIITQKAYRTPYIQAWLS